MRKFYSQDLQNQYQHDGNFRARVDQSEINYSTCLKKAENFHPLELGLHDSMLEKFIDEDGHETYFFYGYLQPTPRNEKDLLLYLIKNFQPEPGMEFTFVYFNQKTPSSDYFFKFRAIFDLLPLRLIQKMRHFYLVKPYFYIKAFDMLGHSNKLFAQRYQTLENCHDLLKHMGITIHAFVTFVPEDISQEFPANIKRRPSLLNYRINVEGQNLSEQQLKEKHDFQLSVKALITKQIYKLENYELGQLGIPLVLQLLVGYFKQKPQMLLQEGIFRKSVSIDEQNQTLQQLSSRNFGYLQQITNPHLIASLIKKFFSNLKEPVIPYPLFDKLMHDQGISNKKDYVRNIIRNLPTLNFLSLMFVIGFLKDDVVPLQKETKMSGHNLAICFSPALMRSEKASFADIVNASKSVTVTDILISDFDYIFGNQLDRKNIIKKSMIDQNKTFRRNMGQELNLKFEDRASEQVRGISTIRQPLAKQQHQNMSSTFILSKQVYKETVSEPQLVKTEIKHVKSEDHSAQIAVDLNQNVSHSQVHFQIFEQEQDEDIYVNSKKNKHDLVQKYLKKENNKGVNLDIQKEVKQQSKIAAKIEKSEEEYNAVTRASISFNFTK